MLIGTPIEVAAAPVQQGIVSGAAVDDSVATATPVDANTQLNFAEYFINNSDAARARLALDALVAANLSLTKTQNNQLDFLLGLLDLSDRKFDNAIHHFHRILVSDPTAVRVRLELGRAYFLAKDYRNAERQFRFARAGKVPPIVTLNIDHYLTAIRSLRTFSYNFALSMAADSDLNAGPATDTVYLYGLPFQLSQEARAKSGVGVAVDLGAEWAPRLNEHIKWRFGSQLHRSQYRQSAFNDMTLSGYFGPHVTLKRWDFNLSGIIGRRWYGDHVYNNMVGGSVDATFYLTGRLGIGSSLSMTHFDYPQNDQLNGWFRTAAFNFFYTPTPASIVRGSLSFGKQDAPDQTWANHSQQYSLSYVREFRGGITIGLTGAYARIAYLAPLAAFGEIRRDHQISGQVTLLDRKIEWHGLTPRMIYTYTHNDSTIPFYTFRRNRVEFGITRSF